MAIVDYRNLKTGEHREVTMPDGVAPQFVEITEAGAWSEVAEPGEWTWKRIDWVKVGSLKIPEGALAPHAMVKDAGGVKHSGQEIPVSMSLPRDPRPGEIVSENGVKVRRHSDGTLSTLSGVRIIRNNEDAKRHGEQCGFVRRG